MSRPTKKATSGYLIGEVPRHLISRTQTDAGNLVGVSFSGPARPGNRSRGASPALTNG